MANTIFVCVGCDRFKFADTKWRIKPESEHLRTVIEKMKRKSLCKECANKIKNATKQK